MDSFAVSILVIPPRGFALFAAFTETILKFEPSATSSLLESIIIAGQILPAPLSYDIVLPASVVDVFPCLSVTDSNLYSSKNLAPSVSLLKILCPKV